MVGVTAAIIGCGKRGVNAHGVGLQRSEKFDLVAVCDLDDACRSAASAQLGVPGVRDYQELLLRPDIEAVVIATSAKWHAPIAFDAIRAGKHVLIEKPLADTAKAAYALAKAAERSGVVGIVGYQHRMSPFAAALAEELPAIEPVQALLTAQRGPLNPQFFFPAHYGGIADDTTHTIHLALWAMGGHPEGVMAHVRRGAIQADGTLEFLDLLVDFAGGARSAVIVSSMFGIRVPNRIEFIGLRGTVVSSDRSVLQVVHHAGIHAPGARMPPGMEVRSRAIAAGGDPGETATLLDHFADLIRGTVDRAHPLACTLAEGADAIAITEAMVRSAEEGRRIPLAELV
ncbi:MAG: Gfo/Idh/MocA family oxidoreductase [Chloroflexi bacterium]|nr:Gfo/Idh/MocA family oxidoreductase [Chloroflexota bacterium]